jgi:hypothetical protein
MTRRHRRRLVLHLAASALAAGCASTGAAGARPATSAGAAECEEVCRVEVENRSAMPLDVILRDGLSVRTLGPVSGYSTATFEVPAGIPPRNIDARLTPGARASRGVVCQFHNRGAAAAARLVCDLRRG